MTEEQYKKANDIMPRIESLRYNIEQLKRIKRCAEEGKKCDMTIRAYSCDDCGVDYIAAIDDKYKLMIAGILCGDYVARLAELQKEFENL